MGALNDVPKAELLANAFEPRPGLWRAAPLAPRIAEIAVTSCRRREPPEIRRPGYVVAALKAALWAFHRGGSYREVVLRAVSLRHDADTTGRGRASLPARTTARPAIPGAWRTVLLIETHAERL